MEGIDGSFWLTLLVRISTIVDESGVLTEFYKNADQNFVEIPSKKQMNSAFIKWDEIIFEGNILFSILCSLNYTTMLLQKLFHPIFNMKILIALVIVINISLLFEVGNKSLSFNVIQQSMSYQTDCFASLQKRSTNLAFLKEL